jgi:hypothetical protein
MNPDNLKRHFVDAMAKHLPPSSSTLRLVDINGQAGDILSGRRADLIIDVLASDAVDTWSVVENSVDSAVAYNVLLETPLLEQVLRMMRTGGRFIAVLSSATVSEDYVQLLEKQGYVRILVEPAVDGLGVLIRGEKAHITDDTLLRIQQVATADADMLDLATFKGRYVHLLIQQTPNKPVWKLQPDEKIKWQAVAIQRDDALILLGFSSLPKAVGFMQPAVVEGKIQDINKVGKFSKETASNWTVMLNPTLDMILDEELILIDIDPELAEASDE